MLISLHQGDITNVVLGTSGKFALTEEQIRLIKIYRQCAFDL